MGVNFEGSQALFSMVLRLLTFINDLFYKY